MSSINDPPMAGDVVELHYWVEYARPDEFKPKVMWTTSPEDLQVTGTEPTIPDNSGPFNYTYVSSITLSRNHIEITVKCSTEFELDDDDAPTGDYDARNEVNYEHETSFTITDVQIPPENTTTVISTEEDDEISDGDVLNPNDKLVCDDKTANPSPSIEWSQDPGPPVLEDEMLVIQEGMVGNYYITCAATNTIHGDVYTGYRAVNISIEAIPTTTTSTTDATSTDTITMGTTSLNVDCSCPVCDSCNSQGALVAVIVILAISLVINIAGAVYVILVKLRSPTKMQDDQSKGSAHTNIHRVTYENTPVPRHHPTDSTTQAAPIIYDEIAEPEPKYVQLDEETRETQSYMNMSSDGAPMYQSLQRNTNQEYIELAE